MPRISRLLPFACGLAAAAATYWKIFEYDLFFHLRAGREILDGGAPIRVDTWTHTVRGEIWRNFEWLSGVVYEAFYRAAGFDGLQLLRAALVAVTMGLVARLAVQATGGSGRPRALAAQILVACAAYGASVFRFQLRPELFGFAIFAALCWIWSGALSPRRAFWLGLGLALIWANLHGGAAPVGIGLQIAAIATLRWSLGARAGAAATTLLAWFVSPLAFEQARVLYENALANHFHFTANPDLAPFRFSMLSIRNGGDAMKVWVGFASLGAISAWRGLPPGFGAFSDRRFLLVVGAGCLAIPFQLARAIPFAMIFFALPVAGLVSQILRERPWRGWLAAILALDLLLAHVISDGIRFVHWPIGRGALETMIPVQAAEFLRRTQPKGNLFNVPAHGAYLGWAYPEMPIFFDGRGFPYLDLYRELDEAVYQDGRYAPFLARHGVNTAVEFLPAPGFGPAGPESWLERFYPRSEWALAFFDNAAMVLLRRIPEHAALIAGSEYRAIRRDLPPSYGAHWEGLADRFRADWESETDRCLRDVPSNVYCRISKGSFRKRRGDLAGARIEFERALESDPRNIEALVQLETVMEQLGDADTRSLLRAKLERLVPGSARRK